MKPAGSFFHQVPDDNDEDDDDDEKEDTEPTSYTPLSSEFEKRAALLLTTIAQKSSSSPLHSPGSAPPTTTTSSSSSSDLSKKPYVALGPPDRKINDVTKPEYDKDGYTLYENEATGEKTRVFEALVEYPCHFMMKIVGAKDDTFIEDVVQTVAESCQVPVKDVPYSTREMGKWTSVTVEAPVDSADQLYLLYEALDKDPRVKFKF